MPNAPAKTSETQEDKMVIVIILLIFFWPAGLILMWMWMRTWKLWVKILITVLCALTIVLPLLLLGGAIWFFVSHPDVFNDEVKPKPIAQISQSPSQIANWKTYTNTKLGYSIKYPPDMTIDTSNNDAVDFHREGVGIGAGMGINGHGMVIYYRTYGAETVESQSRPTERILINNYTAVRWTDNKTCKEDIWIPNPNKQNTIRISFTTCAEKEPYDKTDFKLFNQILQTFKFTDNKQVVCTQDAKLCPDGSYVGRVGPNCEFAACPTK